MSFKGPHKRARKSHCGEEEHSISTAAASVLYNP